MIGRRAAGVVAATALIGGTLIAGTTTVAVANRTAVNGTYECTGPNLARADWSDTSNEAEAAKVTDSSRGVFAGQSFPAGGGTITATEYDVAAGQTLTMSVTVEFTPPVPALPADTYQERLAKWLKNHPSFVPSRTNTGSVTIPKDACPGPPPPVDVCPDIPGDQPEGTDCTPVTPPPPDFCTDYPGDQPEGAVCEEPEMDHQTRVHTGAPDCGQQQVTTVREDRYRPWIPGPHGWRPGKWAPWVVVERHSRHTTKQECPPEKPKKEHGIGTAVHQVPQCKPGQTCLPNTGSGSNSLLGVLGLLTLAAGGVAVRKSGVLQ